MTNFTNTQKGIMNELASYITFKGIVINTVEDMDKAFHDFYTSNFSYNYFNNEDFKRNTITHLKNKLT
jgi:hypothetical protein